jgi:Tfp pilus assembly protein PilN
MPTVNLLSQSEFDRLAARRLRRRFAAGAAALLVLVAAGWGVQHVRVAQQQKLVEVEQAETQRLTAQTQLLAPVRAFINGVAVQERTVDSAMVGEVWVSDVLAGVRDAVPLSAALTSLSVTVSGAAEAGAAPAADGSACPGPDPFNTRVVVGCVQLSGTASSRADVGALVIALSRSGLFVEPFISTTTTGDTEAVTFSGSVGLSEKAYSGRYGDPAVSSTPGQPAAAPAPGAASDTASADGGQQ